MNPIGLVRVGVVAAILVFSSTAFGHGAIVYSKSTGVYGYSYNKDSKGAAIRAAQRHCRRKDCETVLTLKYRCGALARKRGDTRHIGIGRAASEDEAYEEAMESCGRRCKELVTVCDTGG
jgi:hypothetical protein